VDGHRDTEGKVIVAVYVGGEPEDAVMGEHSLWVLQIFNMFNEEEGVFHINDIDSISVTEHVFGSIACEIVGLWHLYEF
jgi:hypothetical protein